MVDMKKRRLVWLLAIGVALVGAMLAYIYLYYAKPVGSGPAGPAVPTSEFAKRWTDRKVLMLGLGDSMTTGYGVAPCHGYFNRLATNPDDEFEDMRGICLSAVLPNLRTKNMAVSDTTSQMHLDIIRDRLETQDKDVFGIVIMTTGGNDLMHDYGRSPPREGAMYGATLQQARPWIENFEKRLHEMIGLLEARFPGGCMIFLADIYDPSDGIGDPASIYMPEWTECMAVHQAYNEVIHRCSERHPSVHVVPIHAEFLGHGIHCTQPWRKHYRPRDPHYWYAVNLADPNIRGYDAIRRVFLIEIAKQAGQFRKL
jgi:lysophospholipase L1-like esterase